MKTYPAWRRLLSWRERFIKRSINASIHTQYQRFILGRISALFFRQLSVASICLFAASFQVCATDGGVSAQEDVNTTVDVPTVIPGVIPIEVDLDDEATMNSSDASVASPAYVDLGQQIETLSQAADLVFHGQVTDVEYQKATKHADDSYPITYVTFSILEILQGTYDAKEIVLMMAGVGYIPPDTFASSSDLPILAKGDEVVIFLAQGAVNGPRYMHHFFVVEGKLYDSESHELVQGDRDSIWRGSFDPKPKVLERPIGVGTMRFVQEHSDTTSSVKQFNATKLSQRALAPGYSPLRVQGLSAHLQRRAPSLALKNQTKSKSAMNSLVVESADKNMPLSFPPDRDAVRRQK